MAEAKRSIWQRLYHGETQFDFVGKKRRGFALSAIVILLGLGSLFARGLNFGIDFEGGTVWELPAPGVSVAEARDALRPVGLAEARVQVLRPPSGSELLRVQAELGSAEDRQARINRVKTALAALAKVGEDQVNVNSVGPSWGGDVTDKARNALIFFFLAITLYITWRFEWKMAVAALAAVVHDILVTVGVYSLSGFEVTPATVIAFLTILGYSLYDTIVVFDKVDENTRGLAASGRITYADTVNLSMNQTLMRSLNTSLVAILPILSVLVIGAFVLGATTLQDFGLALLIGLLTGAYSSIYIASPILAMLKEREPRYASIRQRIVARGGTGAPLTPAAAAAGGLTVSRAGTGAGDTDGVLRPGAAKAGAGRSSGSGGGGPSRSSSSKTSSSKATTAPARPSAGRATQPNRPPPRPRKKGKRR